MTKYFLQSTKMATFFSHSHIITYLHKKTPKKLLLKFRDAEKKTHFIIHF
jgi:hypothetical protein